MDFLEKIIKKLIKNKVKTPEDLAKAKREIAKEDKLACPGNISLLKTYHKMVKNETIKKSKAVESILITRPVRSLSGIVNISVLTKPYPCPGKCLYCPQEQGLPKSYLSGEPAVERAKKLNFDPYLQTRKRIEMLEKEGHPTDKIELRVVGGTFSYYSKQYQTWFIKECFRAANENKIKNSKFQTLEAMQKTNEKAKQRIVGLSVETRPDFINKEEVRRLRKLGVTMVELGVQSIYGDVLKKNLRGHGVKEIVLATKLLKDAGFKILYQMMPNLPGSDLEKDKKMFEELFKNQSFQPDMLKIYPCALLKEAPLYKLWKRGRYKPYSRQQLIELVKSIKQTVPCYVRIQRISRDIPSESVVFGPAKISNLRQILKEDMKKEKWLCKCIRCREVKEKYDSKEKVYLFRKDYKASEGKEIFLSFESQKEKSGAGKSQKLYSLLRLRISSQPLSPVLKNTAIIREIHTYGLALPIKYAGATRAFSSQHRGIGKKLIKEAEKITKKEFKLNKISVISAVGARSYFRKLKYRLKNTYMIKSI